MDMKWAIAGGVSIGLATLALCLALGVEDGLVTYTLFGPTMWFNLCALLNMRRL